MLCVKLGPETANQLSLFSILFGMMGWKRVQLRGLKSQNRDDCQCLGSSEEDEDMEFETKDVYGSSTLVKEKSKHTWAEEVKLECRPDKAVANLSGSAGGGIALQSGLLPADW